MDLLWRGVFVGRLFRSPTQPANQTSAAHPPTPCSASWSSRVDFSPLSVPPSSPIAIPASLLAVLPVFRLWRVNRRFLPRSRCLRSSLPGPPSSITAPKRRKLDRFADDYSTPYCAS